MKRFMRKYLAPYFLSALMLTLIWPCAAFGVVALFNLDSPQTAPFPSDRFTVADSRQITKRRVNLPKPDCSVNISECSHIDILNEFDGFNIQPRLSIPFSGPIDLRTVTSKTVFLVPIHRLSFLRSKIFWWFRRPVTIGINQIVWDPETNTLYVESDQLLQEHTQYALFVTSGIRDVHGNPVKPSQEFTSFLEGTVGIDSHTGYCKTICNAVKSLGWFTGQKIVVASVFTTMSITPILKKMREQIREAPTPAQANFQLGPNNSRTVFSASSVSITHYRQSTMVPDYFEQHCQMSDPSHIIAFGRFQAPNFLTAERYIPQVATDSGMPRIFGEGYDIPFILHLPAGQQPEAGWPVAIFGHGAGSTMLLTCSMHQEFTARGIAVIAFNAIGNGSGPDGFLKVTTENADITIPGVGRGEDCNNDGIIEFDEGMETEGHGPIYKRDGVRQTVAELMQLVRVIDEGVDVDGDGIRDLDPGKIYYFGHSLGGNYGTLFLAVEPNVRVGALAAPAATLAAVSARLSPVFRQKIAKLLGQCEPSLLNAGADFNENIPLRDLPPVVNTVAGAMELQEFFERQEWMVQPGNAMAYAPHLLPRGKKILVQFAMGDPAVPNPSTSAMLRAGGLAKYTTYLRWDILLQTGNAIGDPHNFILNMTKSREQIAEFFKTDGTTIIDPDGSRPAWETPIVPPLPEDTNYFP
jgi:pimeloyl-ACP methyl ester carboxylesterase